MKRLILLAAFIVAISGNLQAQEKMSKEQMQKACDAYATPGDMHKMMAKNVGVWAGEATMWMDPMSPPSKGKGTATIKMIDGGRFQHTQHMGTMNGKPFEGYSITGYDNMKKVFQDVWIDNMGTGIMYMEGTWDPTGKMIHFKGKGVDPVSGKETMVRKEITLIDDNTQKMEMYMTMPGMQEMKTMEAMLKREMKSAPKK